MTELDFTGRNIIITGAGRGIGRAHALLFASRGANVVVADLGSGIDGGIAGDDPATDVVTEITDAGGSAVAVRADVTTPEGARAIVDAAVTAFGGVDVVINNAGIVAQASFEETTTDDLQKYLNVHYFGPFLVTQAAWPHLKKSGSGRVINTISPAFLGVSGLVAYAGSKGALVSLTRTLAIEGAPFGITSNAISPGAATRMLDATSGSIPEDVIEWMKEAVLPEQISPVVAYLAHPDAQDITGEIIFTAGGSVARQVFTQAMGIVQQDQTVEDVAAQIDQIMDLELNFPQLVEIPE
ncbi:SDR family oxidoreductase [Microbacterium sp. NPDC056044]|uniref:SDR family oxidoreductase n=1 Tax=Microbacterium sp. NPDC056044 TaxID=3345690 RepID=UPI0035D5DF72